MPSLQLKWALQNPQAQGLSDPVSNQLLTLNAALTRLEEEDPSSSSGAGPYAVESIERPRRRGGRGRLSGNRLSYVEHSYNQLTNDTYSANSLHPVKATAQLEAWASHK